MSPFKMKYSLCISKSHNRLFTASLFSQIVVAERELELSAKRDRTIPSRFALAFALSHFAPAVSVSVEKRKAVHSLKPCEKRSSLLKNCPTSRALKHKNKYLGLQKSRMEMDCILKKLS